MTNARFSPFTCVLLGALTIAPFVVAKLRLPANDRVVICLSEGKGKGQGVLHANGRRVVEMNKTGYNIKRWKSFQGLKILTPEIGKSFMGRTDRYSGISQWKLNFLKVKGLKSGSDEDPKY